MGGREGDKKPVLTSTWPGEAEGRAGQVGGTVTGVAGVNTRGFVPRPSWAPPGALGLELGRGCFSHLGLLHEDIGSALAKEAGQEQEDGLIRLAPSFPNY